MEDSAEGLYTEKEWWKSQMKVKAVRVNNVK